MKKLMWNAVLGCLMLTSPAVLAENLAYQFVCDGDVYTGWMDERNDVRTTFTKGRSGSQMVYCEADCRPDFGILPCSFTVIGEEGHYEPWVEHRQGLSCDEVCLQVRAVDGQLNRAISTTAVDITRYRAALDATDPLNWLVQSHAGADDHPTTRTAHFNSAGHLDGYSFCWDVGAWGANFWIVKYDLADPADGGRMTEAVLTDGDGHGHVFRALGAFGISENW
jgi:hypothetical protein